MEERLKLYDIYNTASAFVTALITYAGDYDGAMLFNKPADDDYANVLEFVGMAIYGYFYDDLVAYPYYGDDEEERMYHIRDLFMKRLSYDVVVKLPYWYRKYNEIQKLLIDLPNLMQTSKVTSSSQDTTKTAGGSLQKAATTPTGVSTGTTADEIDITIGAGTGHEGENTVETEGFVDKYSNSQQKYASAARSEGSRSGEILREGSIDELINILEKLPSSFADEVTKELGKHFIFVY